METLPEDKVFPDDSPLLNDENIETYSACDSEGRPSVLCGSASYIIVTEFCERLAYNAFAGSLVLFFQTQLHFTNEEADIQFSVWSGFCYVMPLVGGYIADTYLGRYQTILVSILIASVSNCDQTR